MRDLGIRNGWKLEVDDLTGSCFVDVGNSTYRPMHAETNHCFEHEVV